MRPNGQEVLRGVQSALATYILPEVQTAYARTELMAMLALLGMTAEEWDGAAQRLVDDNTALRALARRAADVVDDEALVSDLRALAGQHETSVRISELSSANAALREALSRLAPLLEGAEAPALRDLRAALIEHLRADAEAASRHLMGPRADG
ncbi:MAG: hypothetical protein WEE64_08805 [Dehalococcoidia bacterium]